MNNLLLLLPFWRGSDQAKAETLSRGRDRTATRKERSTDREKKVERRLQSRARSENRHQRRGQNRKR